MKLIYFFILLIIGFMPYQAVNAKEVVTVAAIDWCPQLCPEEESRGYVIDIIKAVFRDSEYQLEIDYYPWSRAIFLAETGKVDALLSPAKAEAPALLYPNQEVGIQRMCFFTRQDSDWQYQGVDSLEGKQIGIATDTSIEELNEFVANHPDQFQYRPYFEHYIEQSAAKLDKGRMDSFLFTHNTTVFELRKLGKGLAYRNAGCVNRTEIYMAFTPKLRVEKNRAVMAFFDKKINELHQAGVISEIMQSYQLEIWK
ncbi:ABC transporter substrate-binding protein [Shewanella sp. UCD-KL12]|uniref:substrate-binding periplasmic protein n=1 Tax=Shewanella sp. UCD-KL12 TaxID=1917163 RepID=UPI000970BCEC|nr:ABC transporter substrate-binding protein [Shewanella sp. UCD-KL12]